MVDKLLSRVLYIDLSERKFWAEDRRDLFEEYLGGTGVAINLLREECPRGADPLGPDNVIIFAVGPLTAVFPMASKTVALFKSPHTGNLGESHAGGRSAAAIRLAGYGAIVIKGQSDIPVYVAIHGDKVYFRNAMALWGMRSTYTVGRIIRENEPGAGIRTIMRIGRAGENLVTYATVVTETYRHFGRLGLGAVFGSKKLKAIVISGKHSIPVADSKMYKEVYEEIYKAAVKSPAMKKYHDIGTAVNILPLNELGALPTMNLKKSRFENAEKIAGEALAEYYLGRRVACAHCPVACIHLAILREPYVDEPYFYKTTWVSYDYEPLYALGTMLGGTDVFKMLKLMEEVEIQGLDAMSTGVVLAWATEAMERGMISTKETLGVELKWGDYDNYIKAVRLIVEQPNEFYKALARGVEYAASKYGGLEFALAFGGNEMPGYHTGLACYVGYLTGARHSHLDSAGYSLDQKMLSMEKRLSPEEIGKRLFEEESWRQILSSLVVCFFARGIYKPDIVIKCLKVMGYDFDENRLMALGRKILRLKHKFKSDEGFDPKKLRIPKRILETESPHGVLSEQDIRTAVNAYFEELYKEQ
ncbi:MAG: aldehyde ferredoxin oxidoreductase family protein [Candidatus Baldrarchaeia archaeon]|mgnify:CR=1 FL=1